MATNNGSQNYTVTVGTSAVQLVTKDSYKAGSVDFPRSVIVFNNSSNVLYLGWGETGATTAVGVPVAAGTSWSGNIAHFDEIYGIASGASSDIRVSILHGSGDPA